MKRIPTPHDRVARASMSYPEVAVDFFTFHLPASVQQAIDFNTLKLEKETFVDEELRLALADMLFSVQIADHPGYLYLLVEHQSTPDKLMPLRVLKYTLNIMEQHSKRYGKNYPDQPLPMIYSTVYYNGRTSYPYSVSFLDLINDPLKLAPKLLEQTFQLVDIGQVDDEAIQARQWSSLMEFFMKHIYSGDLLPYVQRLMPKMYEVESQGGREYLKAILTYILTAGEIQDKGTLFKTVRTHLSDQTGDDIMTIAEQLRYEGKQEGLMEGVERGKQEGLMEGSQQGKLQIQQVIALKLLHQGENIQKISHLTDLTEEDIMALQKAHTH